jgi:hypothetical protein
MLKNVLKLTNRLFGSRLPKQTGRNRRPGCRLAIDALEDRCLPSLTVLAPGFSVSTFAPPPSLGVVQATGPDSIAVDKSGEHVFVGYNNGTPKDGSGGNVTSTIVEYSDTGKVLHYWTPLGHNDGLKIDPETGKVWALQNEDGNPNLLVINPKTTAAIAYTFPTPDNGGTGTPGGYDDITFLKGKVYMTESNPDPTSTGSAVVQVKLPPNPAVSNQVIIVRKVLPNNVTATDPAGKTETLFLSDPDSMTASGDNLVFTSQADNEILTIHNPGPHQFVTVVHTHDAASNPVEVDDTLFTPNAQGAILVVDNSGTVYEITGSAVKKGLVLSSGDLTHSLGTLDPKTGLFTPIITGFSGEPKGLAFLRVGPSDDGSGDDQGGNEQGDNNQGGNEHHHHRN